MVTAVETTTRDKVGCSSTLSGSRARRAANLLRETGWLYRYGRRIKGRSCCGKLFCGTGDCAVAKRNCIRGHT